MVLVLLGLVMAGVGSPASATPTPASASAAAPTRAAAPVVSRPVIEKVAPDGGPLTPTKVLIIGKNLTGVQAVKFGELEGTGLRTLSSTSVEVQTPSGARAGAVPVRVRTAAGWTSSSATTPRYTFVALPSLTSLTPSSASYTGGESVTLLGENLGETTSVTFGTVAATIVSRSATQVVATAPIGVLGVTPVAVTTPGGTSGSLPFTYVRSAQEADLTITPVEGTFQPAQVDWVTGGYDADTGETNPWVVGLPRGAAVPTVGKPLLVKPGSAAIPSGLAGTVEDVAVQVDESVRVTVLPTDLELALQQLSIDYSGPLVGVVGAEVRAAAETAVEWKIDGSSLFCRDQQERSVAFGSDLTMRVTDVDVSQHLDLGRIFSNPSYDASLTAEVLTSGTFHAEAASTCRIATAWANAHRRIFPLGTTGATVSLAPAFEFTVSAKGTLTILDRTRTTFAVSADLGQAPQLSSTSRTVESSFGGALSFDVSLFAGASVQLGILDRAGVESKMLLGVTLGLRVTDSNVCATGKLVLKLTVGLFLDALVLRWESPTLTTTFDLKEFANQCVVAETSAPPTDEPQITSARLPDAQIAARYGTVLQTADQRSGSWSIISGSLPAGLTLDGGSGEISGTPAGPVGDSTVVVDFRDIAGKLATTTIRIRVQPSTGIGGGDVQVTLRWTGPADLDLHVMDPAGEEIYYANAASASGGTLDHDANAGCNGPADDDNAVENVFWPSGGAPAGSYLAFVDVWAVCAGPLEWQLTVRRNGAVILEQSGSGDSPSYPFSLGASAGRAASFVSAPSRSYPPK